MASKQSIKPLPQNQPAILPAVLSILLAVCTWLFIEYFDIGYGIQKYFLGSAFNMKQLQSAWSKNYLKGIEVLGILIVIMFVVYAFFYLVFFECIALLYFFISSRWRNPSVFISYKNTTDDSKTDTTNIALAIKKVLEDKEFRVYFFKYTQTMRHDVINNEIQNMLRKADCMVVIPDPYNPSYVDTEIQCAAYSQKPVFIIKHTKDQELPNTANSGHTVLLLDKLKKEKFKPLIYLLQYVHKNWHTRLFIPGKPFLYFFETITDIIERIQAFGMAMAGFALIIVLLVLFSVRVEYVLMALKIIVTIMGVIAAFITLKNITKNLRLQKVIRQSILNSGKTYELYREAEFDKSIVDCVDKKGLKLDADHVN